MCPEFSDNMGTSLLLIRGELAKKIWTKLNCQTETVAINPTAAAKLNPSIIVLTKFSKKRTQFFKCWFTSDSIRVELKKFTKQNCVKKKLNLLRQFIGKNRRKIQLLLRGI